MTKTKTSKRILEVKIKRICDDSPDTSYLGEYSSDSTSKFSIDRAHDSDCASAEENHGPAVDQLERVITHLNNYRAAEANPPVSYDEWKDSESQALDEAIEVCTGLQALAQECDCGRGEWRSHEYRYFNPSFNYITKADKPANGLTPEDVRKYTRQDYERMESLNAGHWCYLGIMAEAEIGLPQGLNLWWALGY